MHSHEDVFAPLLAAAERLLSREFGREVRLGDAARLWEDGRRNLLVRSRDLCGGFPASFIIKKVVPILSGAIKGRPASGSSSVTDLEVAGQRPSALWKPEEFKRTMLSGGRLCDHVARD